jgi:succinate dehydrogenase/fumarate reductase flavoprotein subunit
MFSPRHLAVIALLGLSAAQDTYDYVIVGGGITGLVVANRLTEDKKSRPIQPDRMYVKLTRSCYRVRTGHRSRKSRR